jgi:hypothetical protein
MKTHRYFTCFILLIVTGLCFTGIPAIKHKAAQRLISLHFHHKIGNEDLLLGNPVKNILGENMVIEKFKYYVSNFSVTDDKGHTTILPVQYFLVDEADSLSKNISFSIPDIPISSIRFLLGVDSIHNVSGVQTGALDPLNGMFWTWNSGYIMAKLEGSADEVASAGHRFTFHIGGFKAGMNATRMIELNLLKTGNPIQEIHVTADINHWFKSNSEIKVSETPVCHSPGSLAMKIADNYSTMFSINSVR